MPAVIMANLEFVDRRPWKVSSNSNCIEAINAARRWINDGLLETGARERYGDRAAAAARKERGGLCVSIQLPETEDCDITADSLWKLFVKLNPGTPLVLWL